MTNEITMPDPEGRELTLREHTVQSTLCHPQWHELEHAEYLIQEVGFDPELVLANAAVIMNAMLETRAKGLR